MPISTYQRLLTRATAPERVPLVRGEHLRQHVRIGIAGNHALPAQPGSPGRRLAFALSLARMCVLGGQMSGVRCGLRRQTAFRAQARRCPNRSQQRYSEFVLHQFTRERLIDLEASTKQEKAQFRDGQQGQGARC